MLESNLIYKMTGITNTFLTKNQIDFWFQKNYSELVTIVKGMSAKNGCLNNWADLFSNTYLYSLTLTYRTELDLRRIVINYAKQQLKWSNSSLKKEIKDIRQTLIPEEYDQEDKTGDAEDKLSEEYEYQLQMQAVLEYKQSLTKLEDKILFDIYFSGCNTRDKLVERFASQNKKMSTSTATRLLKDFRKNITDIYIKNGGTLGMFPNKKRCKK